MSSLQCDVEEYTSQLSQGCLQRAYRGILAFMAELRAECERQYPTYGVSALYPGYMDMSYFSCTPAALKNRKLKVAVVYLHAEGRFELWLAAANRQLQAEYVELLSHQDLGLYTLSRVGPGVDAIIATVVVERPDFDRPKELRERLEEQTVRFAADMEVMLTRMGDTTTV